MNSFCEKQLSGPKNLTFSPELTCECYQIKYFAIQNFRGFAKKVLKIILLIIFTIFIILFWIYWTFDWSTCYMPDIPPVLHKK